MPDDVLHFTCQACAAKLTVPVALAGIEGPCPKCGATIRAPEAAPPEPPPVTEEIPVKLQTPRQPAPPEQPSIRPQPRELPERPARRSVSPRHSTADVSKRSEPTAERAARQPGGIGRVLVPLAFFFIGAALVYFILQTFKGPPGVALAEKPAPDRGVSETRGVPAEPVPPPGAAGEAPEPGLAPEPAGMAEISFPHDPETQDVLREFIRASSLGARLPLIEPAHGREMLEDTVIDTPLLDAGSITPETPTRNNLEDFVDYPFRVRFKADEGGPVETLVIVRKRPEQKPKVLIDPLLDLLGGRLEKFAAEPAAGPKVFRAVIEAMPRCFEEHIPNREDKITYKLSATTHGGEITRAYASKFSPLAEMLYSPDSALRWGKRMPATVTLEWNTTEAPATDDGPARPFLEITGIRSLDWSP